MSLLASLLLAALVTPAGAVPPPRVREPATRPLSPAERTAVELALAYAERGAVAWREYLAPDTPLGRLSSSEAEAEIAVRCGPARGARWQLQTPMGPGPVGRAVFNLEFPSGVDETLEVDLVEVEGIWAIGAVRTLVDPPSAAIVASGAGSRSPWASRKSSVQAPILVALLLGAAAAVALHRLVPPLGSLAGARRFGRAALVFCVAVVACRVPVAREGMPQPDVDEVLRLSPLAGLRAAIAAGEDGEAVERAASELPADPRVALVADLWLAQLALANGDLAGAETRLAAHSDLEGPALAHLLRARLAVLRMRPADSTWQFLRARELGIDHDGLRMEALHAERMLFDDSSSADEVEELVDAGTRLAEPWYDMALLALISDRGEEAERWMRAAWRISPLSRRELFADPLTAALVVRPKLFPLFDLASPDEPRLKLRSAGTAVRMPRAALARTCGEQLEVEVGSFALTVPGGAELAGPLAMIEGASDRERRREEQALAERSQLTSRGRSGHLAPRDLRTAEIAARALVRRQRWPELLALSDGPARAIEAPTAMLLRLRALALRRLGRDAEARALLLEVARTQLASQRTSPGVLYDLADALAAEGSYDDAIRLIRRADSRLPYSVGDALVRQYELRRAQEDEARGRKTRHLELRAPRESSEHHLDQIAELLEKEIGRLGRWIPDAGHARIAVELYPARAFLATYGGKHGIVGLYDGRVRVPFADLPSFEPELVAILSHELAHALLAEATGQRAPRWFQEGLAQQVEMTPGRINPMRDLARGGHRIAFPALEAILVGFAEPQLVEVAYGESLWAVAFIETRWGLAGLHRLERAFARGEETEEALHSTFGLTPSEFDSAFWAWGTGAAPAARAFERVDYKYEEPSLIEPAGAERKAAERSWAPAGSGMAVLARQQQAVAEAFREWHGRYQSRAAAVETAWGPVEARYRAGAGLAAPEECERLTAAVLELRAPPDVLRSGDVEVDNALAELYQLLGDLGAACATAHELEARHYYAMAVLARKDLAEALRGHELEP